MVSVIILSYNTKELLRLCLGSVFSKLSDNTFEVIVVDNASKDTSTAMVKRDFPKVNLIENTENVGFAKGCNIGASKAKGDYLLFLNSDTQIKNLKIINMMELIKKDNKIAVMGGKLVNSNGNTSESFGTFYSIPYIIALLLGVKSVATQDQVNSKMVDWVSGGFMLVKASIFHRLKGFDEQFFMYVEDMEFCYRIKKSGFSVVYYPAAQADHIGQGSSTRSFAILHIYKGILFFYKKHKTYSEYCIVKLLLLMKALIAMFIGTITLNRKLIYTYRNAFITSL